MKYSYGQTINFNKSQIDYLLKILSSEREYIMKKYEEDHQDTGRTVINHLHDEISTLPLSIEEDRSSAPTKRENITTQNKYLDEIENKLKEILEIIDISWRHAKIGHNNPPEAINAPPVSREEIAIGISAINVYRAEISKINTDRTIIDFCKETINVTAKRIEKFHNWLTTQSEKFLETIEEDFGKLTAEGLIRGIVTTIAIKCLSEISKLLQLL